MLAARAFRRAVAPTTAFLGHVAVTCAGFVLAVCVVIAALGAVWTILDAILMLILHWS